MGKNVKRRLEVKIGVTIIYNARKGILFYVFFEDVGDQHFQQIISLPSLNCDTFVGNIVHWLHITFSRLWNSEFLFS